MTGPLAAEAARTHGERRHASGQLRVIVADDDRDTVNTLGALLRSVGHHVYGVHNGREVLPAVLLLRPDALILDIAVPGMSGFAVAQQVRHAFLDVRRPLMIAISGMWKDASDKLIAQQVGFDHYLEKPCAPDDVIRLLQARS